jgi:hypothetical protein
MKCRDILVFIYDDFKRVLNFDKLLYEKCCCGVNIQLGKDLQLGKSTLVVALSGWYLIAPKSTVRSLQSYQCIKKMNTSSSSTRQEMSILRVDATNEIKLDNATCIHNSSSFVPAIKLY